MLDLDDNQLTALSNSLSRCVHLEQLAVQRNRLKALPKWLREIKSLKELMLHGNVGLDLPPEVVGGKRTAWGKPNAQRILDYYFARESGQTRPLNEVKMILVDDGGRGKTETVNRLVGREFGGAKTEETVGINIEDWRCETSRAKP